jgi:hypothetical protein
LPAVAAILPEQLGTARRGPVNSAMPKDPVLDEYGLDAAEQASFGPIGITAWRFRDSTGAMAAFQYTRPADARRSNFDKLAATSGGVLRSVHGNYLFQFTGGTPTEEQYNQLIFHVPKIEQSALPVISTYLPTEGLIPNSERYITGPVSLEKFESGISPSVVAFHLSAEAQYGRYRTKDGELNLAIFAYPTPSIARERADAFRSVPGAVAKRTGPLVVLTLNPPNPDAAERLLAKINYQAELTFNEKPKENIPQSMAKMILGIFELAGIIIGFCLISGLAFAGLRQLSRRVGNQGAEEGMITLHLESK